MDFKAIVGNKIEMVFMNKSNDLICFITTNLTNMHAYCYETYGDCCSTSYIEHISNIDAIYGKVFDINEHKISSEMNDDIDLKIYNVDVSTDKGICTIEFRNESNGYYGGEFILKDILEVSKIDGQQYSRMIDLMDSLQCLEVTKDF